MKETQASGWRFISKPGDTRQLVLTVTFGTSEYDVDALTLVKSVAIVPADSQPACHAVAAVTATKFCEGLAALAADHVSSLTEQSDD